MTQSGPYRSGGPNKAVAGDPEERAWTQIFSSCMTMTTWGKNDESRQADIAEYAARFADKAMVEWRKRWRSQEPDRG